MVWIAARAGALYFALVFCVGFVLGIARELWLRPALGERAAELAEQPVMLVAIVIAARFVTGRMAMPPATGQRLAMGGVALALLLGAELGVVLGLRGLTLAEYVAGRDTVAGAVYMVMLGVYAVMPALVGRPARGRAARSGSDQSAP